MYKEHWDHCTLPGRNLKMIDKEQKKWVTEKWGENEEPEETPTERPHAVSKNKEQIIVDGVDVSRCEHWNICKQCQLSQLPESGYKLLCKDNPNCSFKQLTRKTQECEELKAEKEVIKKYLGISDKSIM